MMVTFELEAKERDREKSLGRRKVFNFRRKHDNYEGVMYVKILSFVGVYGANNRNRYFREKVTG